MTFNELYSYNSTSTAVPVFKHACSIETDDYSNTSAIYAYYGSTNLQDSPYCGIQVFNLSSNPILPLFLTNQTQAMPCRTDYAFAFLESRYLLIAGGQRFKEQEFNDVWLIDTLDNYSETNLDNMNYPMFGSGYSFINNTVYMFSGLTSSAVATSGPSSDYFEQIPLEFYISDFSGELNVTCGLGMIAINNICVFCPPGQFNDDYYNEYCENCS